MAIDRDIFEYSQGEQFGGFRVREQKLSIKNLYRMWIDNTEHSIMKENFIEKLKKDGSPILGQRDIRAEDMARQIATQFLYHQAITKSGTMDFVDRSGFLPNGLIDDVVVTFNTNAGISEVINFSNTWNAQETLNNPIINRVSTKRSFEDDIHRDRLRELGLAAMKDRALAKKAMTTLELGISEPTDHFSGTDLSATFGKNGIVAINIQTEPLFNRPLRPRTLLPVRTPKKKV